MKVGDRVGAICGSAGASDAVEVFGYGVYEGRFPYSEEPSGALQEMVAQEGLPNPRILLDGGERVWGCECWWGPEDEIRGRLSGRTVVLITPSAARARARGGA